MESAVLREDMIDGLTHESKGHLHSDRLIEAMRAVDREQFVEDTEAAYQDRDHHVDGTRVLSPSLVARLFEMLRPEPDDSILVVGVGVGYTAALAAELVGPTAVQALDIDRSLVRLARKNLARAGYREVLVDCGDGASGLPAYAPYDRILLEAAAVAPPQALCSQLARDGRLVLPKGTGTQELLSVDRDGTIIDRAGPVEFAPLLVDGEQAGAIERNRTAREDREFAQRNEQRRRGWEREWIDWDGV